jgi:hypothetical protein
VDGNGIEAPRRRHSAAHPTPSTEAATALARLLPYLERCRDMVGARRRCRALLLWEIALRRLELRLRRAPDEEVRAGAGDIDGGGDASAATAVHDAPSPVRGPAAATSPVAGSTPESLPRGTLTAQRLADLVTRTAEEVDAAWGDIDPGWRKVTLGFELAHLLAPDDAPRARAFIERAEAARRDMRMPAAHATPAYVGCVALVVRAYAGLLEQDLQTEDDLARLGRIIDVLPGWGERAALWADIAVRCFLRGREPLGRDIVTRHVRRLLDQVSARDAVLRRAAIMEAAPALYLAHAETARALIEPLPLPYRAACYTEIARVLITHSPPDDPHQREAASTRQLSHEEAHDVCGLLAGIEHDGMLYDVVTWLADAVVAWRSHAWFSREKQREIAERVRRVVEDRLPDRNNIRHAGYKLIALAQVARMDLMAHTRAEVWQPMAQAARAIPNASDRACVLAHLAVTTPSHDDRRAWLGEAEAAIAAIPARLNRIEDYTALARLVLDADWGEGGAAQARTWLHLAMESAAEDPGDASTYRAQRELIDVAYQFDEALARELAARVDDDPARLAHRLRTLDLKKRLAETTAGPGEDPAGPLASLLAGGARSRARAGPGTGRSTGADADVGNPSDALANTDGGRARDTTGWSEDEKDEDEDERQRLRTLADACTLHLAALHAGRVSPVPLERLREPLAAAARLPLSDAFPIYAWAVENTVQRLGRAPAQARTTLRPLFDALAQVTDLAPRLEEDADARARRAARAALKASRPAGGGDLRVAARIAPGDRAEAERVLRAWCAAHPSPSLMLGDRYFGPEELRWVRLLAEAMPPGCRITILTSRQGQAQAKVAQPWGLAYKHHWRRIADNDPPPVEIVILGTAADGRAPFHDRRLVAAGASAGLAFGGSLNALGGPSDMTITELTPEQAEETERDLDEWARGGAWEYKGERLLRTVFRLDDPEA